MWLVSVSTSAVVDQCASRAGGSPRMPTWSTPPFRGAWADARGTRVIISAKPRTKSVQPRVLPFITEPPAHRRGSGAALHRPAGLTGRTPRASAGAALRSLVQPDVVEAGERHVLVEALDVGLHGAEAEDVTVADGGQVLVEALVHLVPLRLSLGRIGLRPDWCRPPV